TTSGRNNDAHKFFLDHGAGRLGGEPDEAITHHSFNGGADDFCRSVAHISSQRLGLGARRMGMGRFRNRACGRSANRWRDSRVILWLWIRLRLSVLRLRLWLPRLRLRIRIRSSLWLCHLRLWLPGLWLWDWLLRRLQIRLSPRYPPCLCPASLALLKSPTRVPRNKRLQRQRAAAKLSPRGSLLRKSREGLICSGSLSVYAIGFGAFGHPKPTASQKAGARAAKRTDCA